jgi:serine/threonine-protein kinase
MIGEPDELQTGYLGSVATRSSPSTPNPRGAALALAPGQIVAGRYRIVGLLGRGGMGEVYRADDLKLGTPVALKFLPRHVERDPAMLERFHAEVRTARQVSHPHVCRVYDISEVGGRHFLSMEYVDGEDLAGLLRRIGRLPPAKAIEIARQLCAALAAAHEKGVLHRDLKPANVMLDGNGRARVTDFGLAVPVDSAVAEMAGTPAYMAPEQLAGQPASVRSDLYALGLVLYEIFTGRRPFEATTAADWRRVHNESQPPSLHTHTTDIDPAVERVILRCLSKDPEGRPQSATQVALALPGGDPLAAAIAAGETPSPGMVAAAGGEGALTPVRAWLALAAFATLVGVIAWLSPASTDLGLAPMVNSPDVLRDRARTALERLGYPDSAGHVVTWLERDYGPIRWLADHVDSVDWRRRMAKSGAPVVQHYRRAPAPIVAANVQAVVSAVDPAPVQPGETYVALDSAGRLRRLRVSAPERRQAPATAAPFPDALVFEVTGLERARFEDAAAAWVPEVPFSEIREWTGTRGDYPEIPLRLSAATFDGRLVAIAVQGPWEIQKINYVAASVTNRVSQIVNAVVSLVMVVVGVRLVRRNLRLGRGDRSGAHRVAVAVAAIGAGLFVAQAQLHPNWAFALFAQIMPMVAIATAQGLVTWGVYFALEPVVRQRMPSLLLGWARLLEGRVRDARVGRDVLIGLCLGAAIGVLFHLVNGLPTFVSLPIQTSVPQLTVGSNRMVPLAVPFAACLQGVSRAFGIVAMLFVVRLATRKTWALTALLALVLALFNLGAENPRLEIPSAIVGGALYAITAVHFGLLSLAVMWLTQVLVITLPVGIGFGLWYGPYAWATLVILGGLAAWSFITSLGGRPAFGSLGES